jgi:hypothetical protein
VAPRLGDAAYRFLYTGELRKFMKRLFGIFPVLIMLFSFLACASHGVRQTEQPEQVIEEINRGLPTRVDPVTTLEKVTRQGSALTYHYIIDVEATEFPEGHFQRAMNERAQIACDNENRKYFDVVFGVFDCILYDFRGKDGEFLALGRIDKNTCNGVHN